MKCVGPTLTPNEIRRLHEDMKVTPELDALSTQLALAGNATRLRTIWLLAELKEVCVCDLAEILGVSVSAVSQHLAKLRAVRLVRYRRDGQTLYYSLTDDEFVKKLRDAMLADVKV
jgi:DNA-binding transcriptional ArsR family regulator